MNNNDFEKDLKEQYHQLGAVLDKETIVTEQTVKQYKRIRTRLHLTDCILYAVSFFAMGIALQTAFTDSRWWIILLMVLVIILVPCVLVLTPRELELTQEMIRIQLWLGKVEIPYREIASVCPLDYSGRNIRLCGVSGYKVRIGWFWNSNIGIYKAYITNRSDSVLVTLKSGKKRAFSVAHSTEVIEAIHSNIEALQSNSEA